MTLPSALYLCMSSVYLVPARSPCWSVLAGTHHTAAWQQWGWAALVGGGEAQLPMTVAGHDVSRVSSAVPPESNSTGEERGSMSELSNAAVRYVTAFTGGMVPSGTRTAVLPANRGIRTSRSI